MENHSSEGHPYDQYSDILRKYLPNSAHYYFHFAAKLCEEEIFLCFFGPKITNFPPYSPFLIDNKIVTKHKIFENPLSGQQIGLYGLPQSAGHPNLHASGLPPHPMQQQQQQQVFSSTPAQRRHPYTPNPPTPQHLPSTQRSNTASSMAALNSSGGAGASNPWMLPFASPGDDHNPPYFYCLQTIIFDDKLLFCSSDLGLHSKLWGGFMHQRNALLSLPGQPRIQYV